MAAFDADNSAVGGGRPDLPWGAYLRVFRCLTISAHGALAPLVAAVAVAGLAGCATYHAVPLANGPNLASSTHQLVTEVPPGPDYPAYQIDVTHPLTIDEIGILAMLNDPDLKSEFGTIDEARAELVQARLLPNPVANLSYGAIVSGPGAASIGGSLAQSFAAILTYGATTKSAEAHLYQVDAEQAWREWQVAQKARQLALDVYAGKLSIDLAEREQRLMSEELVSVQKAVSEGGTSLEDMAPLAKASALIDQTLIKLRLEQLKNWQQLNGLLGLDANARFTIAHPRLGPVPPVEPLIAAIPARRPDLAALRLGYESAEQGVRAAILGQFPGLTVGGSYNSDTTGAVTAGPNFNFALPIFDRNQGGVSKALASREQVWAKYLASLDDAVATVHGLIAQIHQLSADLVRTRRASDAAQSLASTAHQAYSRADLDQRTLTDYQTTALERALDVVAIQRQIDEDKIVLALELGLGLPEMRIALNPSSPVYANTSTTFALWSHFGGDSHKPADAPSPFNPGDALRHFKPGDALSHLINMNPSPELPTAPDPASRPY
jgi:outer membrane protein, heavy metal efflux system